MTDAGYFGPESVAWRLHADPSALLGGMRALLMQALEPRAMAGVSDHSSFRDDPWKRLIRTVEFVTTVTYGTEADADEAGAFVRRIHGRVRGTVAETGEPYSADDPDLLLYVHATLVHSVLTAYRRYADPRFSDADADQYVREMQVFATIVGTPAEMVPTDTTQLREYFRTVRPRLRMTDGAREGLRVVMAPPMPLPLRPLWVPAALGALAILPGFARSMYGVPWAPPVTPAVRTALFTLTRGLNLLRPEPPAVRAAKARLAA